MWILTRGLVLDVFNLSVNLIYFLPSQLCDDGGTMLALSHSGSGETLSFYHASAIRYGSIPFNENAAFYFRCNWVFLFPRLGEEEGIRQICVRGAHDQGPTFPGQTEVPHRVWKQLRQNLLHHWWLPPACGKMVGKISPITTRCYLTTVKLHCSWRHALPCPSELLLPCIVGIRMMWYWTCRLEGTWLKLKVESILLRSQG